METQGTPKKTRVAVIPQLARIDWLHYALIGGRVVCGLWFLMFLGYGWTALGEYRIVSSAVAPEGAAADAFVRLEGTFTPGSSSSSIASSSRYALLYEGLAKDCGLSSFWHARMTMYRTSGRSGPFREKIPNIEKSLSMPFSITPAGGTPVEVTGVPTRMYGTTFGYYYDPPFLSANVNGGPHLEVESLSTPAGFILGQLRKVGNQQRIVAHLHKGLVFSGISHAILSRNLLLRLGLTILCLFALAFATQRTRRYVCLDRALDRPAQFCVFELTGGSEMFATIGIVLGAFLSVMLLFPPGEASPDSLLYIHGAIALVMAGLTMSASRVEFFYVANKADGMLYAVSRGILMSGVNKVMKLQEFKPKVGFEDVVTKHGTKTSHFIETPTPSGGTLYVSDSYRESIVPAETLSEYERFEKTEMTQTPIDIRRLME